MDGDLAINSMMWQNAGKSGLDQWNFTLQPTSKGQVMTSSSFLVSIISRMAAVCNEPLSVVKGIPPAADHLAFVNRRFANPTFNIASLLWWSTNHTSEASCAWVHTDCELSSRTRMVLSHGSGCQS